MNPGLDLNLPHHYHSYSALPETDRTTLLPQYPKILRSPEDQRYIAEVNLNYRYNAYDVENILWLRAEETGLDLNNLTIIPIPYSQDLSNNDDARNEQVVSIELLGQLHNENNHHLRKVIEQKKERHNRTLIFPITLNQSHWVSLVIKLDEYSDVTTIYYTDSLGDNIPVFLKESLQGFFGHDIKTKIKNVRWLQQKSDGGGCGPLMIENTILAARGYESTTNLLTTNEMVRSITAHHINLMETKKPKRLFNERQFNNYREVIDKDRKTFMC